MIDLFIFLYYDHYIMIKKILKRRYFNLYVCHLDLHILCVLCRDNGKTK